MNQPLDLRYSHSDRSRVFRDVRSKPVPEIAQEQCYFLGFRISIAIANDYRYHHALILADDHDSFIQGIKGECKAIHDRSSATYASDIALVFVRNLAMRDPAMNVTIESSNIKTETQKILSKRNDNQFTVLAMRGNTISLLTTHAPDALAAIQLACSNSEHLAEESFKPLEVCQAHPVTKEFDALFQSAAQQIECLIGSAQAAGCCQH